jgi:hypothetical protein
MMRQNAAFVVLLPSQDHDNALMATRYNTKQIGEMMNREERISIIRKAEVVVLMKSSLDGRLTHQYPHAMEETMALADKGRDWLH